MSYVSLQKLTKSYGNSLAVAGIDLEIAEGEFIALLGPSGCGKTTTLRMVAGFIEPTSGRILVGGKDVTHLAPEKRNMGMVFQNYALFPHMTVRRNVEFGLQCHGVPTNEIGRRIDDVLKMVGLEAFGDRYPRQLSGGQQQRVALARIMAIRPSVLLFDEPLSNLDTFLRVQMRSEIRQLQRRIGVAAIFVTHDQEEAMTMADRIVVMSTGRIEQIGAPSEIYDRPRTRFVARFIGASNFFEGRVERQEGRAVFRTDKGSLLPLDAESSSDVTTLAIRPENIDLGEAGTGIADGVVSHAVQLGSLMEYQIELTSGERVTVQKQRRADIPLLREQQKVAVGWRVDDVNLLTN